MTANSNCVYLYKQYQMRIASIIILAISFFGCRNSNQDRDMNAYFDSEIKNRQKLLDKLSVQNNDSLHINTSAIHEEISGYILLSKDIENLSAAVNKSNAYFLNMANSYGINYSDFTKLNTGMHINEMALVLKQNELNLLNQLIFKSNHSHNQVYTAQ